MDGREVEALARAMHTSDYENAVEMAAKWLYEHDAEFLIRSGWNTDTDGLKAYYYEQGCALLARADLVPRADVEPTHLVDQECPWCEGTGWVCDGCNRPEALCMASECRGAALSMSGCPHCVISCLRAEVDRAVRERDEARGVTKVMRRFNRDVIDSEVKARQRAERAEATVAKLREALEEILSEPVPLDARLVRTLAREALNDERRPGE